MSPLAPSFGVGSNLGRCDAVEVGSLLLHPGGTTDRGNAGGLTDVREADIGDGSQAESRHICPLNGACLALYDVDDASGGADSKASWSYYTPLQIASRGTPGHVACEELLLVVLVLEDTRHDSHHKHFEEERGLLFGISGSN